jgi:hypothetical protein
MDLLINQFDEEDLIAMSVANIIPHASAGAFTVRWPVSEMILQGCTLEQVDSLIQQFDRVIARLMEGAYELGYKRACYESEEKARAANPPLPKRSAKQKNTDVTKRAEKHNGRHQSNRVERVTEGQSHQSERRAEEIR